MFQPERYLTSAENVRRVMQQVYLWMSIGLATTAVTALATIETGMYRSLIQSPIIYFGVVLIELGLVVWLSAGMARMSAGMATSLFFVYSALNGFTLSLILMAYTQGSVVSAFVSTAAMFGAMSIIGATTKTDLTRMGNLLIMALIGMLVAIIVNIFLGSAMINLLISIAGVVIFTGLTAYDTQRISRMASNPMLADNPEMMTKVSIMGALVLYLDFVNLFIYMLRLFGKRN